MGENGMKKENSVKIFKTWIFTFIVSLAILAWFNADNKAYAVVYGYSWDICGQFDFACRLKHIVLFIVL